MKNLLIVIFLALISITACKKERGLSWTSTLNIPIATTTIKLNDFIPDSLLDNTSNPIKLIYNATLYELDKSLLFSIPDTTIKYPFVLPFGSLTVFPGQIISENEQEVALPTGQAQLSRMVVESGFLKYKITSRILQPMIVHYEIRSASKNGQVLIVEVEVPGAISTSQPAVFGGQVNLNNYAIDLTGKNHNTINKVVAYTRLKLSSNSLQTEINSSTSIDFDVTFNQLKPYYARGYLVKLPSTLILQLLTLIYSTI